MFARKTTVLRVLSVQVSLSIRPKLSKLFFRCCGNKVGASFEQHCLMQACIDKKLSSIQTELDANTNMTRRLQSRKAELYEQYRAGSISREKFADIQKTDSEKLARLSSRAEEIKRLLVEHYESRGNLAAGKRTADQIILLKDYDLEIIRNFVERVRVYPSGEIEIDMRTSSGFAFVTAS